MQRNVDDGRILFHKKGGGSFRTVNGRIIKPNQKFRAHPEEIPEAFRDIVVALEPLPDNVPIETVSTFAIKKKDTRTEEEILEDSPKRLKGKTDVEQGPKYEMESREARGWYDVFETVTGKKMNEKAMRKGDAETLLEALRE